MELDDCAFPLLKGTVATADLNTGFNGVNWALLVGSVPRKQGMERGDLLGINGKIFTGQGQAIQNNAASDVRTLVVGNPCNTNCLIAMNNAPDVPRDRWFAMTRLDENRAKLNSRKSQRRRHSREQPNRLGQPLRHPVPGFHQRQDQRRSRRKRDQRSRWLEGDFIKTVQQRGAAIIKARGASSAASAANAVVDSVASVINPTPGGTPTASASAPTAATGWMRV